ncbi:hypothetical protein COLO4_09401 [Corchorus olitorius]|uniref:F-box domain-containing protein n=1 Tax=Corchorus olitorius TaxID=93759 RepID=A0A1R3KC69_9ROSI|nr:hypothetical protein COLO4_09401 [Corchorus olitorius]
MKKQCRRGREPSVMEDEVPFDLMEGILCRLPVKSLLRFKGVCKRWLLLIKNPKFIKLHQRSTQSHTKGSLVTVDRLNQLWSLDLSTLHVTKEAINQLPDDIILAGACNGLLCLATRDRNTIMLWNMSTKEHKILPPLSLPEKYIDLEVGFGYDPCNDDYKVVRFYDWAHRPIFYSLRLNSWGSKNYTYNCFGLTKQLLSPAVYVDGALNWTAPDYNNKSKVDIIISLDLNTEKARALRLPYYEPNDGFWVNSFDVLDGNLCVGFLKDTRYWRPHKGGLMKGYGNEDVVTDIWVMKEYGNDESWTKLFSFRGDPPSKPLTYIHGDQVLLLSTNADADTKDIICYNLKKKKFSLHGCIPERKLKLVSNYEARICHESLVPINPMF